VVPVTEDDEIARLIEEDFQLLVTKDKAAGKDENVLAWETNQRYKYYFAHQKKHHKYYIDMEEKEEETPATNQEI